MKVLVMAQQKGGAGKTTLAAHLAVAAQLTGTRTVLFDTDPQQSLAQWWNAREAEAPTLAACTLAEFPARLAALRAAGYGLAVVDTPGAAVAAVGAVVALADLVLVPVRPSPTDLRALSPTLAMLQAAGRPFRFILSAVNSRSRLTAQAVAALSAHGPVAPAFVESRTDLVASMTDGRTALETAPGGKAAAEIRALWTYTRQQLRQLEGEKA